jgi:hypothetical protein
MEKPDLIVSTPDIITVPAVGPDWWTNQTLDPKLTEDRYIQAVESKPLLPKSEKVIHHATTSMRFPEGGGGQFERYTRWVRTWMCIPMTSASSSRPAPRST